MKTTWNEDTMERKHTTIYLLLLSISQPIQGRDETQETLLVSNYKSHLITVGVAPCLVPSSKLCVSLCCPHGEELKFFDEGSRCSKTTIPDYVNYTLETYTRNGQLVRSLKQHEDFNVVHFPVNGKLKHSRTDDESYEKIDHLQPGTFCVDPVDYSLKVVEIDIGEEDQELFVILFSITFSLTILLSITFFGFWLRGNLQFKTKTARQNSRTELESIMNNDELQSRSASMVESK